MRKIIFFVWSVLIAQSAVFAESYAVKPDQSAVKWTAAKITGKHFGSIGISTGTIQFEGGEFTGGDAVIDTASLTVEDLSGGGKQKLEDHLKSADFFDTATFPSAAIQITDVKAAGESLYDITADLTIKEMTHPVKFQAQVEKNAEGIFASAMIKVDRTLYDIRYGSGKFFENLGDRTIEDHFTLDVSINAA